MSPKTYITNFGKMAKVFPKFRISNLNRDENGKVENVQIYGKRRKY